MKTPTGRSSGSTGFQELEKDFTRVPNLLFDRLLLRLSHGELRVLLFIIRNTLGWRRRGVCIPLSQFRRAGVAKSTAARAIKSLVEEGLILRFTSGGSKTRAHFALNTPHDRLLHERYTAGDISALELVALLSQPRVQTD